MGYVLKMGWRGMRKGTCGGTRKEGSDRWLGSQALRREVTAVDNDDGDADVDLVKGDEVGGGAAGL